MLVCEGQEAAPCPTNWTLETWHVIQIRHSCSLQTCDLHVCLGLSCTCWGGALRCPKGRHTWSPLGFDSVTHTMAAVHQCKQVYMQFESLRQPPDDTLMDLTAGRECVVVSKQYCWGGFARMLFYSMYITFGQSVTRLLCSAHLQQCPSCIHTHLG